MIHDFREQMVAQRFEETGNGPSGEGGTQLPPTSQSARSRASSERSCDFIRTTSSQIVIDQLLLSPQNLVVL
ncbi:hypothetical protein KIN20_000123 [Parelaphostrongylus tenuis]|uniref:Uncharacterized protein n=1 Tax=Parelaphostrongylus tenuis TaxID=148309 RepID=A0AAD5MCT4_PARTN|nr:hypothetical protein KIN20_000123 [Parelaphostrongylus tenuis]